MKNAPGTPCLAHLNTINYLSTFQRQQIADFRVDELDEKLATEDLLVDACKSTSQRFPDGGLYFQENAFNRMQAMHFRVRSIKKKGARHLAAARREHFKLKHIHRMHYEWELDEDIDECVDELSDVNREAMTYMPLDREV